MNTDSEKPNHRSFDCFAVLTLITGGLAKPLLTPFVAKQLKLLSEFYSLQTSIIKN